MWVCVCVYALAGQVRKSWKNQIFSPSLLLSRRPTTDQLLQLERAATSTCQARVSEWVSGLGWSYFHFASCKYRRPADRPSTAGLLTCLKKDRRTTNSLLCYASLCKKRIKVLLALLEVWPKRWRRGKEGRKEGSSWRRVHDNDKAPLDDGDDDHDEDDDDETVNREKDITNAGKWNEFARHTQHCTHFTTVIGQLRQFKWCKNKHLISSEKIHDFFPPLSQAHLFFVIQSSERVTQLGGEFFPLSAHWKLFYEFVTRDEETYCNALAQKHFQREIDMYWKRNDFFRRKVSSESWEFFPDCAIFSSSFEWVRNWFAARFFLLRPSWFNYPNKIWLFMSSGPLSAYMK